MQKGEENIQGKTFFEELDTMKSLADAKGYGTALGIGFLGGVLFYVG